MATKRLIDANEYPCNRCEISYCYKNCTKFNAWLDRTVDAVEVVHGWWIVKEEPIPWCEDDVDMFWECSVCECRNYGESPYCPNCGAKMDGDGNDI